MTRAELLELLKKARKQLKKYHVPKDEQTVTLSIDTLENALSEQPQIVRCKDCKYCDDKSNTPWLNCMKLRMTTTPYWFCADGERKPTQTNAKSNALDVR